LLFAKVRSLRLWRNLFARNLTFHHRLIAGTDTTAR
jgi:hypothetical protein